jgi:hypothetical protein
LSIGQDYPKSLGVSDLFFCHTVKIEKNQNVIWKSRVFEIIYKGW